MTADSKTANVLGSAGVGAGIGGLAGLGAGGLVGLLAPKGKRLRAALMGAGTLGPLGAISGGVMGASYAHDPRAFAQGIVPAVTAGAIGSGIGTYLASKKPKAKPAPADSKKKDAPGDDIKEAALSLTNLPIKQPSIDRAHSTTFRVEKAINKAKEEREKNEMSTAKSAGVTIPGVTTHEDAKQHAQNTGNYHVTYRTADGKKNVYFKAEKKPVVAKKADAAFEFGRLVKLAAPFDDIRGAASVAGAASPLVLAPAAVGGLVGMPLGALYGALTGRKGDRWGAVGRGAIGGALVGGGIGGGLGIGHSMGRAGSHGVLSNDVAMENAAWGGRGGAGLGGIAGILAAAKLHKPAPKKKEPAEEKQSALNFGRLVKRSFLTPAMQSGGLAGAGLGALGGGLVGLMAPGEEEDEDGNVRRRSGLSGALRGALGGAGLGGAVGVGMGYMAPGMTNQLTGAGKKMVGVPTTGLTDGEYQAGLPAADAPGDVIFG